VPFDAERIRRLEALAGLRLSPAERARLAGDLSRIVAFVDRLARAELPADAVERSWGAAQCPRRPDAPAPSLPADEALAGAPQREGGCFRLPPVRGGEAPRDA
jgi:aspartyl-tRNA(Asn)/glutamyl-tRNA(Gln) amidotransferase subunit C